MAILKILMLTIEAICSLLLVVVILLQKTKSGGLGMAFGSGMGETLFGSRAGNVLTKITITLGIVFLVNTLFLGIIVAHSQTAGVSASRSLMGGQRAAPATAPRPLPKPPAGSPTLPAGAPAPASALPSGPAPTAPAPAIPPAAAPAPAATPPPAAAAAPAK